MTIQNLLLHFKNLENKAHVLKNEKLADILNTYGSKKNFIEALKVRLINKPENHDFKRLYNFYSSFFTLPEETESFEGFEKTLNLNSDESLQKKYNRFEEAWIYLEEPGNNRIIAGVNFSTYPYKKKLTEKYGHGGSVHIIYIFVEPAYRSMGLAHHLLLLAGKHAELFAKSKLPFLCFCEQNAPELMTITDYFNDNINALVDQCDRLIWWHKAGYKRIVFNYIQPPLNKGQDACLDLTLNVKTNLKKIPSELVAYHLERFFMLAVFKSDESLRDEYYWSQMNSLRKNEKLLINGCEKYYRDLKKRIYASPADWMPIEKLF